MAAWLADDLGLAVDPRTYTGPSGPSVYCPHARVAILPDRHDRVLMRFRLGVWDLANAHPLPGTVRCERVCMFCARLAEQGLPCPATIIEDEHHVLLECPAFHSLPEEFADRLPLLTPEASDG